jgi:hypothetical protein
MHIALCSSHRQLTRKPLLVLLPMLLPPPLALALLLLLLVCSLLQLLQGLLQQLHRQ